MRFGQPLLNRPDAGFGRLANGGELSAVSIRHLWPLLLVLACALGAAPAAAQSDEPAASDEVSAAPDAAADAAAEAPPLPENFSLGDALTFDPGALATTPAKPLRLPKPVASDVATKFGADTAPDVPSIYQPGQPLPGSAVNINGGAAWASVGLPDFASVDARVDPNSDQRKLGTTLQQAVPFGSSLAMTLQGTLSVTDTGRPLSPTLTPATPAPLESWGNEEKLKFDVLASGTSFSAGVATNSIDPITHNTLSADQKIYGPLHVTTALNDIGAPTNNKSIKASLKLNW